MSLQVEAIITDHDLNDAWPSVARRFMLLTIKATRRYTATMHRCDTACPHLC